MKKFKHVKIAMIVVRRRELLTQNSDNYQEFKRFKRAKIVTKVMQHHMNEVNEAIESIMKHLNELTEQCERTDQKKVKKKIDDDFVENLTRLIDEAILTLRIFQEEMIN